MEKKRSSWSSTVGFVMAASGSAIGLGNIWRFPYLAAKDGGGVFILCYIVLALTFGFTLLTTEIAIGRRSSQSPLTAYKLQHNKFGFIGGIACLVPVIILPYYCTVGGWVVKYFVTFLTGGNAQTVSSGYFSRFIASPVSPIVYFVVFLFLTGFVVFNGVNNGIEKYSKVIMPILFLLIIIIAVFALFLQHTDSQGVTRTGLEGFKIYLLPDFSSMTLSHFLSILTDAMGQLFYSISVAMGIMVTYGSYVPKDVNINKCVNQIEFFDTLVALLAGMMIVPAVYVFMGQEGMSAGPGLIFISLPKVFYAMGKGGGLIGLAFFLMVIFAAVTSSVSVMEAIVSSVMDRFKWSRKKATFFVFLYALIVGIIVCLGYNVFYFEAKLPNGAVAQILDIMDYASNNIFMPLVAILTCCLIGYVTGPKIVIDEVTLGDVKFYRKKLYIVMVKFIAPVLLFVLLLRSFNLLPI